MIPRSRSVSPAYEGARGGPPGACVRCPRGADTPWLAGRRGGLLFGSGDFTLGGDRGEVAFSAALIERGAARFVAAVPGLGRSEGDAELSGDGLELTLLALDEEVTLRKDACGNEPPEVELVAVGGPELGFREPVTLAAQVADEDDRFPPERLVFTSHRDGVLTGSRLAGNRTLVTPFLSPGAHRLRVTVTDSGGLTGSSTADVTVENRPPLEPIIEQPAAGTQLPAQAPALLRGNAYDPDEGFLSGDALAWSLRAQPGGPFVALGTGGALTTVLAAAAGPVTLRLTATDAAGAEATAERTLTVLPPGDDAPPVVAIVLPDPLLTANEISAAVVAGAEVAFEATAHDLEDPLTDLELAWEFVALSAAGGDPLAAPPVPNPPPVSGSLTAAPVFAPAVDTFYRATFTATDSGGLASSHSVEILVLAQPIR